MGAGASALSGAGKGAAIGTSIFPGIGTAVGAGVGGLVGFFAGRKKDKKAKGAKAGAAIDPNSPEGMLQSRAKTLQDQSSSLVGQGAETLGKAGEYYEGLLGSDPGALLEATKAERGRVIDQYDTARQAISEFGPRGGGATSAMAASRVAQANQLSDITAQAKQQAVTGAADVGATIANLGMTAEQVASADLNTVLNAMLSREGHDIEKRGQTMGMWSGIGEAAGSILGSYFGGKAA
jgi:hypothetical protein